MSFNRINFQVIEDCFGAAESKEAIYNIFIASATQLLDHEIKVIKPESLPTVLRTLPKTLGISNEKAVVLILSLHALMKEYIAVAVGQQDENLVAEQFPEGFAKKIKTFLFKMMREVA